MHSEQVSALNKIMAMIDQRAAKQQYMRLPQSKRFANRKLILDLIDDATELGNAMKPAPREALDDLKRLAEQLNRLA